jgi:hypothetical protein
MKNSNNTIGNRTRDLPVCSAVPQPTAPPRAPLISKYGLYINFMEKKYSGLLLCITKHSPVQCYVCLVYYRISSFIFTGYWQVQITYLNRTVVKLPLVVSVFEVLSRFKMQNITTTINKHEPTTTL